MVKEITSLAEFESETNGPGLVVVGMHDANYLFHPHCLMPLFTSLRYYVFSLGLYALYILS